MDKLVSVVMPIYNPDEKLLNLAISSVFQQDYRSWELIISDDGDSYEFIKQFDDKRIKYTKNKGARGIFPNLNNAIRHATGYYLQIFCQDDIMLAGFISDQVLLMKTYPDAKMGFSSYRHSLPSNSDEKEDERTKLMPAQYFLNGLFVYGCMPGNLSPVIIKKECFDSIGYFDETFKYCGDHEYWIRLAENFNACYSFRKNLLIRLHEKQASNTLPIVTKLDETIINYRRLYKRQTVKEKNWKIRLHINERFGIQFLKIIIKNIIKGRLEYFAIIKKLHNDIFNLPLLVLLSIITVGNKIKVFQIHERSL